MGGISASSGVETLFYAISYAILLRTADFVFLNGVSWGTWLFSLPLEAAFPTFEAEGGEILGPAG